MNRFSLFTVFGLLTFCAYQAIGYAQNSETLSLGSSFTENSQLILSRNGNSVVGTSTAGGLTVIRNAFQIDQEQVALPEQFTTARILAVSYYGTVFAASQGTTRCEVFFFNKRGAVEAVPFESSSDCKVLDGASNVVDRLLFAVQDGGITKLFALVGKELLPLWDNSSDRGARLESYAINDLNTIVFTVSTQAGSKRVFRSLYWVPGAGVRALVLPRAVGSRAVVLDVSNKNQYLLTLRKGIGVFDPAKRKLTPTTKLAERLTSNGSVFSSTQLFSTDGRSTRVSCFARGALSGFKLQFGAINDERELVLVARGKGSASLSKVIPLTVKGYPGCR
jgi:hypothetical protein